MSRVADDDRIYGVVNAGFGMLHLYVGGFFPLLFPFRGGITPFCVRTKAAMFRYGGKTI